MGSIGQDIDVGLLVARLNRMQSDLWIPERLLTFEQRTVSVLETEAICESKCGSVRGETVSNARRLLAEMEPNALEGPLGGKCVLYDESFDVGGELRSALSFCC